MPRSVSAVPPLAAGYLYVRALAADAHAPFMPITGRPRSETADAVRSNMRCRALQRCASNPNPNPMKIYKRLDRVVANATLIGVVLACLHFFGDESLVVGLLSVVVMVLAIVTYGFFIASQHCPKCHGSFVGRHPKPGLASVLLVFHVPSQCPHCGARTQW
jgi:hypothetical protein